MEQVGDPRGGGRGRHHRVGCRPLSEWRRSTPITTRPSPPQRRRRPWPHNRRRQTLQARVRAHQRRRAVPAAGTTTTGPKIVIFKPEDHRQDDFLALDHFVDDEAREGDDATGRHFHQDLRQLFARRRPRSGTPIQLFPDPLPFPTTTTTTSPPPTTTTTSPPTTTTKPPPPPTTTTTEPPTTTTTTEPPTTTTTTEPPTTTTTTEPPTTTTTTTLRSLLPPLP